MHPIKGPYCDNAGVELYRLIVGNLGAETTKVQSL